MVWFGVSSSDSLRKRFLNLKLSVLLGETQEKKGSVGVENLALVSMAELKSTNR